MSSAAAADTIISSDTFVDPAFMDYVRQFDTNNDNILQDSEIAAVESIDVNSMDISRLDGIGTFTSLKALDCSNNNITALDLSANTQLEMLDCSHNNITALDLSANTQLEKLDCSNNNINILDLSALTKLREVKCIYSGISTLNVSGCTALEDLCCYGNNLTVLDVTNNTALVSLDFQENFLSAIDLTHNPLLHFLDCGANNITSLNLDANTQLRSLYCRDLKLGTLNVSNLPELHHLWCWNDNLSVLDLSANPKLQSLMCYDNNLTELTFPNNAPITELACGNLPLEKDYTFNTVLPLNVDAENGVNFYSNKGYGGLSSNDLIANLDAVALDDSGNSLLPVQFYNVRYAEVRVVFEKAPVLIKYNYRTANDKVKLSVSYISPSAKALAPCWNGIFEGVSSGDILSWKGVPYAKSPTGSLRWKAPQAPDKSSELFSASDYAATPIQHYTLTNPRELMPAQDEDCLALNVWNNSRDISALKPVIVWVHGGSFNSGGTANPDYNGDKFIQVHDDVVFVSVGYRVGIMGFIDFVNSGLPGCEEFPDSQNLGLLDVLQAVRWIRGNIAAFGGDPANITLLGQSSGAAAVALLMSMPESVGLFQRAITQSGAVSMTQSIDDAKALTQALVQVTSADTMDKLMALSSSDLQAAAEKLQAFTNFPERDGKIVAANPYEAFAVNSVNFDLLTGSMKNEVNYYALALGGAEKFIQFVPYAYNMIVDGINAVSSEDAANAKEFVSVYMTEHDGADEVEAMCAFLNDLLFTGPVMTEANTSAGKTYAYYWEYPSYILGLGACHALDVPYVFNDNANALVVLAFNQKLADDVQAMWVNFAKTGNPSTASITWPEYDTRTQPVMIIDDPLVVQNTYLAQEYALIQPLMKYGISGRELTMALAGGIDTGNPDTEPTPENPDTEPEPGNPDTEPTPENPNVVPVGGTVGASGNGCNAGFMFPMMFAVLVFVSKKKV